MKTYLFRGGWVWVVAIVTVVSGLVTARAQNTEIEREPLPNFDRRLLQSHDAAAPAAAPAAANARSVIANDRDKAESALRKHRRDVRVDRDGITGAPAFVGSPHGFLSGPNGGATISPTNLVGKSASDPHRVVKGFIDEYSDVFGHKSDVLTNARVSRDYVTPHNGLRTVNWEQQVDGVRVFEAGLQAHLTKKGELVNISSRLVSNPQQAAARGTPERTKKMAGPAISAQEAVMIASAGVAAVTTVEELILGSAPSGADLRQKYHGPTLLDADVRYVWLPMDGDTLRLCWQVICTTKADQFMYLLVVDAETGELVVRHGLTEQISNASYRVFTGDSPSPFTPGLSTPGTYQPPLVERPLVTLSALDTNASPNGWIDDGVMETRGNNVDAHTDLNSVNVPDLPRPQAIGPNRVFDPSLDLTQDPSTYKDAAVVNLFYWCNFMHDKLYGLGFTEAAGNFQNDNFGRGGAGNDAVQADAQDGGNIRDASHSNNAVFSSPPDGLPGRMQMYIFTGPTPDRDGAFDAEVMCHEYTHGLSNRLVGGGVGMSAMQSRGMGEGWSDFYPLSLLSDPNDDVDGNYPSGGYASYMLRNSTQNYYFGIRRYPYSTDMTKNPLTLKDIDPTRASAHDGIPRNPISGTTANQVHNMGEVWCVTLWEARARLVKKLGAAAGNQLMLQLTTDGMKLSPANPTYLQARDAIIQADLVNTGGANRAELWAAFAKRGMGFSAYVPANSTTTGVIEAFDLPDDLSIAPMTNVSLTVEAGGVIPAQNYILTNTGASSLSWNASNTQPWLTLSATAGTLAAGESVAVTLSFDASALSVRTYSDTVTFNNITSGRNLSRAVSLTILPPRFANFPLDTDPGWTRTGQWSFGQPTGGGGTNGYPDPRRGATGTNVFGINLSGDYATTSAPAEYLTAGPFNLTGYANTRLQFQQWLNCLYAPYVTESIDVSRDGMTWTRIWTNPPVTPITVGGWSKVQHDISAVADNQPTVYIRWGHQITSTGVPAFSGWNIDDVELLAETGAAAPTITSQPVSQTAAIGDDVTFSVTATGLPEPVYQWYRSGARISGATASTLVLHDVQLSSAGAYTVVVSNSVGSVTSSVATLSGSVPPPTIVTQPANVVVIAGQSATLSVQATGPGVLVYQWRRNGFSISGATGPSLVLSNVSRTDADYYDVVVGAGLSITISQVARLSVAPTSYATTFAPDPAWSLSAELSGSGTGYAMASLSDGRAYIAGQFTNTSGLRRTGIARTTADGLAIDPTFIPPEIDNTVRAIAVQNDGKVLLAGDFVRVNGLLRNHLVRLNTDGSVDTTFAPAGNMTGIPFTLALQSDGRILVGGAFGGFGSAGRNALIRLNSDGTLDSSFLTMGMNSTVNAVVVQSDGRIVVGGGFSSYIDSTGVTTPRIRIARLNSNGTLDTTFVTATPNSTVNALAVQTDGKILLGGSFTMVGATTTGCAARLNANGSLDSAFTLAGGAGFNATVLALAVQPDGRIVAGGNFTTYAGATANRLARLNGDGTRDTTLLTQGMSGAVQALVVQPNGQILAGGIFSGYYNATGVSTPRARFVRLNADGTLNAGLNFAFRSWGTISSALPLPGGKLLVTGIFNYLRGSASAISIARLNADGTIDQTFNPGGAGANSNIYASTFQADGKILIAGYFTTYNGLPANGIARLNVDGTLDASFSAGAGLTGGLTLGVLPGGRIFVGGNFSAVNGVARGRVAILNADGSLDASFAPAAGANSTVNSSAILPDGKILIGGAFSTFDGTITNRIARLNPNGTLDTSFSTGTGANLTVYSVAVGLDGKIVVGGVFTSVGGLSRIGVARLNSNGTPDTTFVPPTVSGGPVYNVLVQEDGRVVIRGAFTSLAANAAGAYIARLNVDGSRDTTFVQGGINDVSSVPTTAAMLDNGQFAFPCGGATGFTVTRSAGAPAITTQPSSQTVIFGDAATFSVGVSSAVTPLYQWLFNGLPIPAANYPTLTLTNVQMAQAGTYSVVVTTELGSVTSAPATLTINKAQALVVLADLAQTYNGAPRAVTVTTTPAGLPVVVTYDGSTTVPVNGGSYTVVATVADANYEGAATGTLVVAKTSATVMLSGLATVYDGVPKSPTATTSPTGLNVVFTYAGSTTAPTHAGSYAVSATIDDINYTGSVNDTLVIARAPAAVSFGALTATYDGTPKSVSVVTSPAGLNVAVAYNSNVTPPTDAGSYTVTATVTDPNYVGGGEATLVVEKATATISLSNLTATYDGTPKSITVTTTPEDQDVTVTYNGSTTLPTYPGTYAVVATIETDNYTGSLSGVLSITTTVLVLHAPVLNGGIDGSIQLISPEDVTFNSSALISGDLLVPGSPSLVLNGHPLIAGTRDAGGSADPSGYRVTLNGGATLRYLVCRMNPLTIPSVPTPPSPTGTRRVTINRAGQSVGDFATLRDLTLNGNAGLVVVPAGTYGNLTASSKSGFTLGVAGATTATVYNLQNLALYGNSRINLLGPVVINLANGLSLSGVMGSVDHPEWLTVNVASGGLMLNGHAVLNGFVVAPLGTVTLNSDAVLRGGVSCDRLVINTNGLVEKSDP